MLPPPDLRLLPEGMRYPGKQWKIEKHFALGDKAAAGAPEK
jgi:hypothetical protein